MGRSRSGSSLFAGIAACFMEESKNEKEDLIMNSSKVKEFVKSHKKELIAGAMLVGGTVLVIIGVRHSRKKAAMPQPSRETVRR